MPTTILYFVPTVSIPVDQMLKKASTGVGFIVLLFSVYRTNHRWLTPNEDSEEVGDAENSAEETQHGEGSVIGRECRSGHHQRCQESADGQSQSPSNSIPSNTSTWILSAIGFPISEIHLHIRHVCQRQSSEKHSGYR